MDRCDCDYHVPYGIDYCPMHKAAPDMLEALRELLYQHAIRCAQMGLTEDEHEAKRAVQLARAAIVKAEGND